MNKTRVEYGMGGRGVVPRRTSPCWNKICTQTSQVWRTINSTFQVHVFLERPCGDVQRFKILLVDTFYCAFQVLSALNSHLWLGLPPPLPRWPHLLNRQHKRQRSRRVEQEPAQRLKIYNVCFRLLPPQRDQIDHILGLGGPG